MPRNLRESIVSRLENISTPKTTAFAQYLRGDEPKKIYPCWGEILEYFETQIIEDDDRLAVWAALVEEHHPRPIQLFLMACSDRPEILQTIEPDVHLLSNKMQAAYDAIIDEDGDPPPEVAAQREKELSRFVGEVGMILHPKYQSEDVEGSKEFKAKVIKFFLRAIRIIKIVPPGV